MVKNKISKEDLKQNILLKVLIVFRQLEIDIDRLPNLVVHICKMSVYTVINYHTYKKRTQHLTYIDEYYTGLEFQLDSYSKTHEEIAIDKEELQKNRDLHPKLQPVLKNLSSFYRCS